MNFLKNYIQDCSVETLLDAVRLEQKTASNHDVTVVIIDTDNIYRDWTFVALLFILRPKMRRQ